MTEEQRYYTVDDFLGIKFYTTNYAYQCKYNEIMQTSQRNADFNKEFEISKKIQITYIPFETSDEEFYLKLLENFGNVYWKRSTLTLPPSCERFITKLNYDKQIIEGTLKGVTLFSDVEELKGKDFMLLNFYLHLTTFPVTQKIIQDDYAELSKIDLSQFGNISLVNIYA